MILLCQVYRPSSSWPEYIYIYIYIIYLAEYFCTIFASQEHLIPRCDEYFDIQSSGMIPNSLRIASDIPLHPSDSVWEVLQVGLTALRDLRTTEQLE